MREIHSDRQGERSPGERVQARNPEELQTLWSWFSVLGVLGGVPRGSTLEQLRIECHSGFLVPGRPKSQPLRDQQQILKG